MCLQLNKTEELDKEREAANDEPEDDDIEDNTDNDPPPAVGFTKNISLLVPSERPPFGIIIKKSEMFDYLRTLWKKLIQCMTLEKSGKIVSRLSCRVCMNATLLSHLV